jgi:cytochrome P450
VTPLEVMGQSGLLLFAAHETVTNLIANGVLALLNHPEELAKLRADPGLALSAVHEILRYDSPTLSFPRWATADLEVPVGAGLTIPAGAKMQMAYGAANRDPDHYEEPERFDVNRGATDYMSFGFDRHLCLGRHLALIEGEIAIAALIERFPKLRLADGFTPQYHHSLSLRALKSLPLVF